MKTVTELYQEAQSHLERVDVWRKGMMDKIREDSRRKAMLVRETYMLDAIEQQFRDIAKELFIPVNGVNFEVSCYQFTQEGVFVTYHDDTYEPFNYLITWEDMQDAIDKKLGVKK